MKLLKAIIRPNKVDDVKDALAKLNLSGMTVTEVRGHGKQKGHTAVYRGKEYNVSLLPKMQVEVVVADSIADDAIRAIVEAARTGEIGDGHDLLANGLRAEDGREALLGVAHGDEDPKAARGEGQREGAGKGRFADAALARHEEEPP